MAKAPKKEVEAVIPALEERKRGWKSVLIRDLKKLYPSHTHAALAEEFLKKSGEQVSIPTIIQALKDNRSDGKGSTGTETLNDLLRVKKWCAENNVKPEALARQLDELSELANKVGGIGALDRILGVIQDVRE